FPDGAVAIARLLQYLAQLFADVAGGGLDLEGDAQRFDRLAVEPEAAERFGVDDGFSGVGFRVGVIRVDDLFGHLEVVVDDYAVGRARYVRPEAGRDVRLLDVHFGRRERAARHRVFVEVE